MKLDKKRSKSRGTDITRKQDNMTQNTKKIIKILNITTKLKLLSNSDSTKN
jgi:hypothetical protein